MPSNNRFQVLMDEPIKSVPSKNNKNANINISNQRNNFSEKLKKPIIKQELNIINSDNFPELKSVFKNIETINKDSQGLNYFNKLLNINNSSEKEINIPIDNFVPDGCVSITMDKNNKCIWLSGKNVLVNKIYNEKEECYKAIERVVNLYRERKNKYIKNWGIDEYEKMFLFPNYEYDYFDKIDEMEELDDYYYSEDNYNDYSVMEEYV